MFPEKLRLLSNQESPSASIPGALNFFAGKYSLPPSNSEKTQGLFEGKVIDVVPTAEQLRSK